MTQSGLTSRALSPRGTRRLCHTLDRRAHDKRYCTMTVWHLYASTKSWFPTAYVHLQGAAGTEDEGTARRAGASHTATLRMTRTNTLLSLAQSEARAPASRSRSSSREATGCKRKPFTSQKEKPSCRRSAINTPVALPGCQWARTLHPDARWQCQHVSVPPQARASSHGTDLGRPFRNTVALQPVQRSQGGQA